MFSPLEKDFFFSVSRVVRGEKGKSQKVGGCQYNCFLEYISQKAFQTLSLASTT